MIEGSLVVYESTVYPGCTEEDCIPVLESESDLRVDDDFLVGYSPERINPGDKAHSLKNTVKITSGSCPLASDAVDALYGAIVEQTHLVGSIKVAEAAKVIENSQRDINIAFVNELSLIFRKMGLDTNDILDAAATKWNFLNFRPGLVGGHCISIDPYYLAHKAQEFGYHPEVILAGRRVNDGMGEYVAHEVVKLMIQKRHKINGSIVKVFGCAFKENCADVRNSRVFDIIRELKAYGCSVDVVDPFVDPIFVKEHYGVDVHPFNAKDGKWDDNPDELAAVIVAVAHDQFRKLNFGDRSSRRFVVYDVKGILPRNMVDGRL
jgi:UDP-N-acetyl-D-galactosamine dehydrogenase